MIKNYEAEVYTLTKDLESARQQVHQERLLRQQLEDELRQMFLKNMTSMNIEAFRIFQNAQVTRDNMLKSVQRVEESTETENISLKPTESQGERTKIRDNIPTQKRRDYLEAVDIKQRDNTTRASVIGHKTKTSIVRDENSRDMGTHFTQSNVRPSIPKKL